MFFLWCYTASLRRWRLPADSAKYLLNFRSVLIHHDVLLAIAVATTLKYSQYVVFLVSGAPPRAPYVNGDTSPTYLHSHIIYLFSIYLWSI